MSNLPLQNKVITSLACIRGQVSKHTTVKRPIRWCVHMEISALSTGMNSRNTTKLVEHKFVLFATFKAFWTLATLLIKLIRILLKWKYIQDQNYMPLCWPRYVLRAKLFCLNSFVPVTGLEFSYGKIFIPVTEISVAKTEISVTGPARPLI